MAVRTTSGVPMQLFELFWASGGRCGTLVIWAPDSETAIATVEAHPSRFGIPFSDPIVGRPTRVRFAEPARAA